MRSPVIAALVLKYLCTGSLINIVPLCVRRLLKALSAIRKWGEGL
jgi:hypothetical protein